MGQHQITPAPLLAQYWPLFQESAQLGPVIDLACGLGRNGLFLATRGIPVILIDRSADRLEDARQLARNAGVEADMRPMDLEQENADPLEGLAAGGILVFRYLHRPLIPAIQRSIRAGGILMYETFTRDQQRFGKPRNPDHLLKPLELRGWFQDWEVLHYFEGVKENPPRAVAQIVCRQAGPLT
jgi:tellurite methyltransferase